MKKGWQTKRLEEVCEIARGGSPRPIENYLTSAPDGINWVKIGDATASEKYIYQTAEKITPDGVKRSRMVYEGDFLLSNSMSFGRPYIMRTSGCIHDGWLVLRQKEKQLEQDFLYYLLSSDELFRQFDRLAAGSTVRNLNIGLVKRVEISFPPLEEQQRIVAVLDEAFAGLATAQANAEKNLQNARALFESHLHSVFTHRGKGWMEESFEDCIEDVKHTTKVQRKDFLAEGRFPIVSQEAEFTNGYWNNPADVFRVTAPVVIFGDHTQVLKYIDFDFVLGADGVKILQPKPLLLPKFFFYQLRSIPLKSLGYARHYRLLKEVRITCPQHAEQQAIVAHLDALSAETQRLTQLYERKLAALAELKKSLLHAAFSGHL
ncbi:restriction endonuclease subunit S [Oleiharenicola sp. Vm1]|uniref:restriction endonuclease subunit S n=1 Tax=Oleiharenicola sp. Vm1 TaxID=3398393 RepID=UPI0039F5C02A